MTITRGPEAVSPNRNPVFEFNSDAVDVEFACRLNGRAFASCTSPKAYTNLADGAYTFEVQGRDAFGNVSSTRHQFVVDQSAPVLSTPGFGQNSVTGQDVSIAVGANEGALTLTCSLDGGPAVLCGTSINLTGLALGEHTLVITATDAAGNVGTLIRRFVVVEFVPPAPPEEPTVTVIEDATGQSLTVRIADIDRRVDLARLQEQGVTVRVIPARGTQLIRFRIIRVSGNGRNRGGRAAAAAAGSRKQVVVATIYRRVKPGKSTITPHPQGAAEGDRRPLPPRGDAGQEPQQDGQVEDRVVPGHALAQAQPHPAGPARALPTGSVGRALVAFPARVGAGAGRKFSARLPMTVA